MKENKLIAEFMGMQHTDIGWYDNDEVLQLQDNTFDDLDFHKSWDWLMPVVEKIFSLGYHYEIKPRYMMIKERTSLDWMSCEANFKGKTYNKSQKEIIYNAVVEFIKQYNKNK